MGGGHEEVGGCWGGKAAGRESSKLRESAKGRESSKARQSKTRESKARVSRKGRESKASARKARETLKKLEDEEEDKVRGEPYYHGAFPRENVDAVLERNGEFLLRLNEKVNARLFVVDVRWAGAMRHFRINTKGDGVKAYFIRKDKTFPTVKDVVDYHWKNSAALVERGTDKDGLIRLESPAPRSRWELNSADIQLGKAIGRGAFGEVFKGRYMGASTVDKSTLASDQGSGLRARPRVSRRSSRDREKRVGTGIDVAIKLCKQTSGEGQAMFEKEAMFALKFKHKNIIEAIGVVLSENSRMIVLEFMPNGALQSYLKKQKATLTMAMLKGFCLDAGRGMEYLEHLHCIHRDVATRNCLVGAKQEVKISDFGLAKGHAAYKMVSSPSSQCPPSPLVIHQLVGRVAIKWMAPESMRLGEFSHKSDVWAFGVLLWEVFTFGADPYPGLNPNHLKSRILKENYRMPAPPNMPPMFGLTMAKCWETKHQDRPTFADVVRNLERLPESEGTASEQP